MPLSCDATCWSGVGAVLRDLCKGAVRAAGARPDAFSSALREGDHRASGEPQARRSALDDAAAAERRRAAIAEHKARRKEKLTLKARARNPGLPAKDPEHAEAKPVGTLDPLAVIQRLPMQASTLDPATMVADLDPDSRESVFQYLEGCMKASPEVRHIFETIVRDAPASLRVKEVFETVECLRQAAAFVTVAAKIRPINVIYDLACGHGLLGVLLAYRFPGKEVVCVDLERRDGFDKFVRAFELHGQARNPEVSATDVVGNLTFVTGDLADTLRCQTQPDSLVLAVHGCNEATQAVLEGARAAGAAWGVMPCCIRDGLYLPCGVKGFKDRGSVDDQRHAVMCGAMAAKYGAERLNLIDRRITNRNIFIFGGVGFGSREAYLSTCEAPARGPQH